MPYRLFIRRSAEKEIASLSIDLRNRVIERVRTLATTPRPIGCIKLSSEDRAWRIRIGDYRVVYAVNDSEHIVEIRTVAHRRDVYR